MRITVNELSFRVVHGGEGPAALLLHGFPDSSALWRHQVPALVDAGHRVIAPDLRGFGASDRPAEVDAYRMDRLVGDVLGILDALGVERASVVGHDWGAALGWALAAFAPDRVHRLAALSVGHPAAYFTDALTQREKSWYVLFFQFPGIAEDALRHDSWALFRALLRDRGRYRPLRHRSGPSRRVDRRAELVSRQRAGQCLRPAHSEVIAAGAVSRAGCVV